MFAEFFRDSSCNRARWTVCSSGMQIHMNLDSDEDEFESLPVLPRRHNTPAFTEKHFTYLAPLKESKLSTEPGYNGAVRKIKCVLTGVKDFQYKDCDEFTLIVHIDDGSLVTEAFIQDDVRTVVLFYFLLHIHGRNRRKEKKVVGTFEHIFSQWNELSSHVMSLRCWEHEDEFPFTKHEDEFSIFERPAWGECQQDRNLQPSTLEQS